MSATSPAFPVNAFQHGSGPACSYYQSTLQSVATSTYTVVQTQTKEFDTDNAFNTSTYIFQPKVAGIYQVNGLCGGAFAGSTCTLAVFKNGVQYKRGCVGTAADNANVNTLVALNGGSDYIDIRVFQATGTAVNTTVGINFTYFNAAWIRGL